MCARSLRYPACNVYAPYFIVKCGLSVSTIFLYIISLTEWFKKKTYWTQDVFWFYLKFIPNIFHSIISQSVIIINMRTFACKIHVFLSYISETWIFSTDFRNILKYQISRKSIQWELSCFLWTDGLTDRHDETFRAFAKTPKNLFTLPILYAFLSKTIRDSGVAQMVAGS